MRKLLLFFPFLLLACAHWPLENNCSSAEIPLEYKAQGKSAQNNQEAEKIRSEIAETYKVSRASYISFLQGLIANKSVSDSFFHNMKGAPFVLSASEKRQLLESLKAYRPKLAAEYAAEE